MDPKVQVMAASRNVAFIGLPAESARLLDHYTRSQVWKVSFVAPGGSSPEVAEIAKRLGIPVVEVPGHADLSTCDRIVVADEPPDLIDEIRDMMKGSAVEIIPCSKGHSDGPGIEPGNTPGRPDHTISPAAQKFAPLDFERVASAVPEAGLDCVDQPPAQTGREEPPRDLYDAQSLLGVDAIDGPRSLRVLGSSAELTSALRTVLEETKSKSASIMLPEVGGERLRLAGVQGEFDLDVRRAAPRRAEGIAGSAFATLRPRSGRGALPNLAEEAGGTIHRVAASVPITVGGHALGVLSVNLESADPESETVLVAQLERHAKLLARLVLSAIDLSGSTVHEKAVLLPRLLDRFMSLEETFAIRLQAIAEAMGRALSADYVHQYVFDPLGARLLPVSGPPGPGASSSIGRPADRGLFGWTLRQEGPRFLKLESLDPSQTRAIVCLPVRSSRPYGLVVLESIPLSEEEETPLRDLMETLSRQLEEMLGIEDGVAAQDLIAELQMRIADRTGQIDSLPPSQRERAVLEFALDLVAAEAAIWIKAPHAQPVVTRARSPQAARLLAVAWENLPDYAAWIRREGTVIGGADTGSGDLPACHLPGPCVGVTSDDGGGVLMVLFCPDERAGAVGQVPPHVLWRVLARLCELMPHLGQDGSASAESHHPSPFQEMDPATLLTPRAIFSFIRQEVARSQRYGHRFTLTRFSLARSGDGSGHEPEELGEFLLRRKREVDLLSEVSPGSYVLLSPETETAPTGARDRLSREWTEAKGGSRIETRQIRYPEDATSERELIAWTKEAAPSTEIPG